MSIRDSSRWTVPFPVGKHGCKGMKPMRLPLPWLCAQRHLPTESGTEACRQGLRVNPKVQPVFLQLICTNQRRAQCHGAAAQGRGVLHTRFRVEEGHSIPVWGTVGEQVEAEADGEEV